MMRKPPGYLSQNLESEVEPQRSGNSVHPQECEECTSFIFARGVNCFTRHSPHAVEEKAQKGGQEFAFIIAN